MNIIKTVLQYRGQYEMRHRVLAKNHVKRSPDIISDTKHLIKYMFHLQGYSHMTIERHLGRRSDGFNHASVIHSVKIVEANPNYFQKSVNDLKKILQ
jgi:hypothetical protein